ncbi:MAG: protein-L-isoaspartate O-methyltransferase [Alphaproteobacteria bacterium]|nr:protein-L-isoaspartate O-methyltransferase [Alphaproteobacteria bacterium]MBV8412184.1 protein-L-isoaspartate O-methyltransferase [Alphaproteobacteria bacterium]
MTDFAVARRNMIDGQLRPNRVTNDRLLAAVGDLPRERFLPDALRAVAYADDDVPLGNGRFLMEPMVLGRLIQALQAQPEDRALIVGAGRGYGAALMSRLVKSVVAVESDAMLAAAAEQTAKELGLDRVRRVVGPMEAGAADAAPYDVILIEGAVRLVPDALLEQLAEGGRLTTVLAGPPGAMGVAQLFIKQGGVTSGRALFEAGTPLLPGFTPPPRFTF